MIAYLSLIVCLIGLVVYALATNPKAAEAGRIAYAIHNVITLMVILWEGGLDKNAHIPLDIWFHSRVEHKFQ